MPKIFLAVADALVWAFWCLDIISQIHSLDDFLFFSRPDSGKANSVLAVL